jgi:hypothetical protein
MAGDLGHEDRHLIPGIILLALAFSQAVKRAL